MVVVGRVEEEVEQVEEEVDTITEYKFMNVINCKSWEFCERIVMKNYVGKYKEK